MDTSLFGQEEAKNAVELRPSPDKVRARLVGLARLVRTPEVQVVAVSVVSAWYNY